MDSGEGYCIQLLSELIQYRIDIPRDGHQSNPFTFQALLRAREMGIPLTSSRRASI